MHSKMTLQKVCMLFFWSLTMLTHQNVNHFPPTETYFCVLWYEPSSRKCFINITNVITREEIAQEVVQICKLAYHNLMLVMPSIAEKTWKYICISHPSSTMKHCRLLKSTPKDAKNIHIAHGQYHGCWWPGDARSHGISSHGIDLNFLEYSGLSTRRVSVKRYTVLMY